MTLLHTETKLVAEATGKIEKLVDAVNAFAVDLKKEGGTLSKSLLNGFLEDPNDHLKLYFFDSAIKALKLKEDQVNSALKSGIWKGAEEASRRLMRHQVPIQDAANKSQVEISQLSFTGGKCSISDSLRDEITEKFSYYLAPEDEELYNRIQSVLEILAVENGFTSATIEKDLLEGLKVAMTESSLGHFSMQFKSPAFREELLIVRDGGRLIPNPAFFHARATQPKTTTK